MNMKAVSKAVILAAGMGSRFLPWSKVITKDFLPILNKPVLQHVIDEIKKAGITEIIVVTKQPDTLTESYFRPSKSMEEFLEYKGKSRELKELINLNKDIKISFIYQKDKRRGNAIALESAKAHLLNESAFLVYYIDDLVDCGDGKKNRAELLIDSYNNTLKSTISLVESKTEKDSYKYGMPIIRNAVKDNLFDISGIREKPGPKGVPSSYLSTAGYVLSRDIWPYFRDLSISNSGEYEITDILGAMAKDGLLNGLVIEGKHLDTGNPISYIKSQLYFALNNTDMSDEIRQYIRDLIAE